MKREILLLLLGVSSAFAEDVVGLEADVMRQLPDCDPFPYNAYSGYLDVSETKSLHYVFVQSQSSPQTDPLLIWFNGGPGCSSLLGFFQENGPWIIDDGETYIKENPYPWNLRANVMYLESPAGVGYSRAGTDDDRTFDDMTQSYDTYAALVQFYKKFPTFLNHELYISGESYAGIYVPYLAWQIDQHNLQAPTNSSITFINLKGFLVGNGVTDFNVDGDPAFLPTANGFHILPPADYQTYVNNKCYFSINNLIPYTNLPQCDEEYATLQGYASDLNWYDLFRKLYPDTMKLTAEHRLGESMVNDVKKTYKRGYTMDEYAPWLKRANLQSPLLGDYVSDYANRADVRQAMNIPDDIQGWDSCSGNIDYTMLAEGSYWIWEDLRGKYKMLKYSGDTDGAVPTYGTKLWIAKLGWPILESQRPWFTNGQVSGQVINYDGLDFVTIHGVGHMCPQWKREDTTKMVMAWIHGESFEE